MKVSSIISYNLKSNHYRVKEYKSEDIKVSSDKMSLANIPSHALQNNVSIAFGLKLPYEMLPDVPCAYCGRKMINKKMFRSIKLPKEWFFVPAELIIDNLKKQQLSKIERIALGKIINLHTKSPTATFQKLVSKLEHPPQRFSVIKDFYKDNPEIHNQQLIKALEPFTSYMHDVEASIFKMIKRLHARHPQKTFQQLFELLRPMNLQILEQEQVKILSEIEKTLKPLLPNLGTKSRTTKNLQDMSIALKIKELIAETERIMIFSSNNTGFRRKVFIRKLNDLTKQRGNEGLFGVINQQAETLPTSRTSKSAFIVKYSGMVSAPDGSFQYKSSQGIAYNLVCSAEFTLDHKVPLHLGGENSLDNAIGACADCNNSLKGHIPFKTFIKRPGVINNINLHNQYLINHNEEIKNVVKSDT